MWDLKRAGVKIYHTGKTRKGLAAQPCVVEVGPHQRTKKPMLNMEMWKYHELSQALAFVIGGMYRAGVDVGSKKFQDGIIQSHNRLMREALVFHD